MEDPTTLYNSYSNSRASTDTATNAFLGNALQRLNPDICDLLREQKKFLEEAEASEIRASFFLRLRLSAQQKATVQRNQIAERLSMQNKRKFTPAAEAAPVATMFNVNRSADEEEEPEDGWRCPGCLRRYIDVDAYTRHTISCKKNSIQKKQQALDAVNSSVHSSHAAMPKAFPLPPLQTMPSVGGPTTTTTFKSELEVTNQRLHSLANHAEQEEEITSRGLPVAPSPSNSVPLEQTNCRAPSGSNTVKSVMTSAPAESQSTNFSSSNFDSLAQEERKDEKGGDVVRALSLSRDFSASSAGMQSQQKTPIATKNSIDDVPASVAQRTSLDRDSAFPLWLAFGNPLRSRDDLMDSLGSRNLQNFSCRQSSVAFGGTSASGMAMGETEGADEPLRPCPYCGRHFFAETRWPRHVAVCEQQQQQQQRQRKSKTSVSHQLSESRSHRMSHATPGDSLNSSCVARDSTRHSLSFRGKPGGERSLDARRAVPKWRRQHAQLHQAMQRNSGRPQTSGGDRDDNMGIFEDDRIACPTCGRRFAAAAAERHMPFCKERQGAHKTMRI